MKTCKYSLLLFQRDGADGVLKGFWFHDQYTKQFLSFSFDNIMHLRDFITSLFQNEPDTKVYVI